MSYIDAFGNAVAVYSLGIAPATSLSAVSAVQAGTALDGLTLRTTAVLSVTTTAGVSAGAVQLQGSIDGTHFYNLGSAVTTTAASTTTQVAVSSAYSRYVRAAITTSVTGGSISASVALSG
jgi:hypothetical protein